jgi:RNA polymerase sigma-70 factor (ECF subfamily)
LIEPKLEARLTADLRGGQEERERALSVLFEHTRESLYGIALRMTGRPDLADDAVQETFVGVLRGADGFRGDARLATWLYRIAVRAAMRVSDRSRRPTEPLPEELAVGSHEPPEELAQREGAARILAAMAQLPATQRAVLALAALDDLPQTEIAVVLGVPPGTVYSRLHQARERMREALEQGGP